jgi:glucose-6-phosphate isomerase
LEGFLLGTREALFESGRQSITITVKQLSPFTIGVLIALFERAGGLYASLINVNAYHQPGVEAGKKAATAIIDLQLKIMQFLSQKKPNSFTADQLAEAVGAREQAEAAFKICEHLAANPGRKIEKAKPGAPSETLYRGV